MATVADGWFVAWWPGSGSVTSAQVTTAAGTTTEPLVPGAALPGGPSARASSPGAPSTLSGDSRRLRPTPAAARAAPAPAAAGRATFREQLSDRRQAITSMRRPARRSRHPSRRWVPRRSAGPSSAHERVEHVVGLRPGGGCLGRAPRPARRRSRARAAARPALRRALWGAHGAPASTAKLSFGAHLEELALQVRGDCSVVDLADLRQDVEELPRDRLAAHSRAIAHASW